MFAASRPSILTAALVATALAGCATNQEPTTSAKPVSTASQATKPEPRPEPAPKPAIPAIGMEAYTPPTQAEMQAKAASQSKLVGTWEGKWEIDNLGYEGKAVLKIERVEGNEVFGVAIMSDTPYGDMTETFVKATFDGTKMLVKHKSADYALTLTERDSKLRFSGPLHYTSESGNYTGRLKLSK